MRALLMKNRIRLAEELSEHDQRKMFSPALYSLDRPLMRTIKKYARGNFIDIGCGDMPYRGTIEKQVEQYDSIDRQTRGRLPTYTGDIQDMNMIGDGLYDSAVCLSVLEHVPQPSRALAEIHRILKEDGVVILSVPFLARLHEVPDDYYRFTGYGLRFLLEQAGFDVQQLTPLGGVFSFLGHQISTAVLCSVWHLPVIKQIAFGLNLWLCVKTCSGLDEWLRTSSILPLGYLCVARKKSID
ncbi:MAG TPA: methyltransferase domain-containing protein [Myxococcota bacterium]|nr:methyltransferase domain-containing protein [Myxococcota bacterium]